MNYRDLFPGVALAVAALTFAACSSTPNDPTPAANQPSPIHDMAGRAELYDECNAPQAQHAGITVSIEGTALTTTTQSDGSFRFPDLPTGEYTLVFGRDGYSPYKIFRYPLKGDRSIDIGRITLRKLPTWHVDGLVAEQETTNDPSRPYAIRIGGMRTASACTFHTRMVTLFIGNSDDVSPENHAIAINYLNDSARFDLTLTPEYLYNHGLQKGDQVYFVAYPSSSMETMYDETTKKHIRLHMSPERSNLASMIVP